MSFSANKLRLGAGREGQLGPLVPADMALNNVFDMSLVGNGEVGATNANGNRLAAIGSTVFVGDAINPGLLAYDFSDPENPSLLGSLSTPAVGAGCLIAVGDTYIYHAFSTELKVLDVSDPAAMFLARTKSDPNFKSIDAMAYYEEGNLLAVISRGSTDGVSTVEAPIGSNWLHKDFDSTGLDTYDLRGVALTRSGTSLFLYRYTDGYLVRYEVSDNVARVLTYKGATSSGDGVNSAGRLASTPDGQQLAITLENTKKLQMRYAGDGYSAGSFGSARNSAVLSAGETPDTVVCSNETAFVTGSSFAAAFDISGSTPTEIAMVDVSAYTGSALSSVVLVPGALVALQGTNLFTFM